MNMLLMKDEKVSPWATPMQSDFADDFILAAEYRGIRDQDSFERELAPTIAAHLDEVYDTTAEPISLVEGEKLALLARRYIDWCKELPVVAIPGRSLWVASYLAELRDEGCTDSEVADACKAISRAHYLMDHSDPTHHPRVRSVVENLRHKPTEKETE